MTELAKTLTIEHAIALAGLIVFGYWLLRTGFGTQALIKSRPRRHKMPLYVPFLVMFVWFGPVQLVMLAVQMLAKHIGLWQEAALANIVYCVSALGASVTLILLARVWFARRLRGFGLNLRNLPMDVLFGFVNLLAIWPLIMAAMLLTIKAAQLIWGEDFQMPKHRELELIAEHSELALRITVVVVASVVAPLLEELLFRGMLQTVIRTLLIRGQTVLTLTSLNPEHSYPHENRRFSNAASAWLAITVTSLLFAIVHADMGHWPALFVLSVCLGYSYEKSGSLFRPIIIHSIFNTVTVLAALYG